MPVKNISRSAPTGGIFIAEPGSVEVRRALQEADFVATHMISRVEVSAALAKAVRTKVLREEEAAPCLARFRKDWPDLIRLRESEAMIAHADLLAWDHGLRGYDAVHLAAAELWQDAVGDKITFAVFDWKLWYAADKIGLLPFPEDPDLLRKRRR